jgi:hypothetical protein
MLHKHVAMKFLFGQSYLFHGPDKQFNHLISDVHVDRLIVLAALRVAKQAEEPQ